jgi:hypothetical protein
MHRSTTVLLVVAFAEAIAHGQTPFASTGAARELAYALDRLGVDAIAAADPDEPGRFAAALYIPGHQLLVVSARHPSVEKIEHRLTKGEYSKVYFDLQATPTPQEKFFVQDNRADGILSALPGSGDVDALYEGGVKILFNGDTRSQNLTSSEYEARRAGADARYARLLKVLEAAVHRISQSSREVLGGRSIPSRSGAGGATGKSDCSQREVGRVCRMESGSMPSVLTA